MSANELQDKWKEKECLFHQVFFFPNTLQL